MRLLAALMVSLTLLSTGLLVHGLATYDERPSLRPAAIAERGVETHDRYLAP